MLLSRLTREPLLHFFALGGLLFAIFALTNRDALRGPDVIVVDEARVAALAAQFERVWQRTPTPAELDGLVDNWVREEMLYREGLALGLEADDPVIRRRVVQKLTFMNETLVDDTTSDAELEAWLERHPGRYRVEPRMTFRQAYLDPNRHGAALDALLDALRERLVTGSAEATGDATLLPAEIRDRTQSDVARTFGADFAEAVLELPAGEWAGPVRSGFGLHFVRVESVVPGRDPTLEEARAALERDVLARRREAAASAFVDALSARYTVERAVPAGTAGAAGASP